MRGSENYNSEQGWGGGFSVPTGSQVQGTGPQHTQSENDAVCMMPGGCHFFERGTRKSLP